MLARHCACLRSLLPITLAAFVAALVPASAPRAEETVTIGDLVFVNKALVGVGRLPSDLRDKFGETFGSGSGIAVDPKSWTRTPAGYQGTFYMLPDRGYNVRETIDYRARINKLSVTFKPLDDPQAVPLAERQRASRRRWSTPSCSPTRGGAAHRPRSQRHPPRRRRLAGPSAGPERARQHRYRIPGAAA